MGTGLFAKKYAILYSLTPNEQSQVKVSTSVETILGDEEETTEQQEPTEQHMPLFVKPWTIPLGKRAFAS
jgi:hypothetical protein